MKSNDRELLTNELYKLSQLKTQLEQQDELIKEVARRSQPWEGIGDSQMTVISRLFEEIAEARPDDRISFINNNDPTALRSQIVAARSKLLARTATIHNTLDLRKPPAAQLVEEQVTAQLATTPDRRQVFVVHGRNKHLTRAMFEFLRAINLNPIEWEEAIQMSAEGAPHNESAVQAAFSNSWAAVVVLTERMWRVGKQFRLPQDHRYEQRLTAQARPNVLLELGMAIGLFPTRTIIVECGAHSRPLTDIQGLNTIHFTGDVPSRMKLADRLRNARCAVVTEGRQDWLTAGVFPPFTFHPDHGNEPRPEKKHSTRDEQIGTLQQQIAQLTEENLKLKLDLLKKESENVLPKSYGGEYPTLNDSSSEIIVTHSPMIDRLDRIKSSSLFVTVSPIFPTSCAQDKFRIMEIESELVRLEKIGTAHNLFLPVESITQVLAQGNDRPYTLKLNGRLQWLTTLQEWRFFLSRLSRTPSASSGSLNLLLLTIHALWSLRQYLRPWA